jgi:hypothetical protein
MPDRSRPELARDIRYRVVGGEAVVVRQRAGEVLAINPVGAFLLEGITEKATVAELVHELAAHYDVEYEQAEQDVHAFLAELVEAGVVVEHGPEENEGAAAGSD